MSFQWCNLVLVVEKKFGLLIILRIQDAMNVLKKRKKLEVFYLPNYILDQRLLSIFKGKSIFCAKLSDVDYTMKERRDKITIEKLKEL